MYLRIVWRYGFQSFNTSFHSFLLLIGCFCLQSYLEYEINQILWDAECGKRFSSCTESVDINPKDHSCAVVTVWILTHCSPCLFHSTTMSFSYWDFFNIWIFLTFSLLVLMLLLESMQFMDRNLTFRKILVEEQTKSTPAGDGMTILVSNLPKNIDKVGCFPSSLVNLCTCCNDMIVLTELLWIWT